MGRPVCPLLLHDPWEGGAVPPLGTSSETCIFWQRRGRTRVTAAKYSRIPANVTPPATGANTKPATEVNQTPGIRKASEAGGPSTVQSANRTAEGKMTEKTPHRLNFVLQHTCHGGSWSTKIRWVPRRSNCICRRRKEPHTGRMGSWSRNFQGALRRNNCTFLD